MPAPRTPPCDGPVGTPLTRALGGRYGLAFGGICCVVAAVPVLLLSCSRVAEPGTMKD